MIPVTEKQVQQKILRYLRSLPGSWWYKTNDRFQNGIPDIIGFFNGGFFAFEVKRPGAAGRPLQDHTVNCIGQAGGVAMVVDNVDAVRRAVEAHAPIRIYDAKSVVSLTRPSRP